jgi:hypothetical protein
LVAAQANYADEVLCHEALSRPMVEGRNPEPVSVLLAGPLEQAMMGRRDGARSDIEGIPTVNPLILLNGKHAH